MYKYIVLIGLTSLVFPSCKHEPDLSNQPTISFVNDIQPLIGTNCSTSGCHDGSNELITLESYDEILKIVKPNKARESELYQNITKLYGEQAMPPSKPLTEGQIQTIYLWIMQGAQNN